MGILEDFGYDPEDNTSYSPDEQPDPKTANTDISAARRTDTDLPTAIIQTAKQIGINPLDLATAISYETGGTFNPRLLGPQTKNGQGRGIGLIQFMSNGAAKDYGVTQDTPAVEQLKAAGRYLVDRGVKAGMGLLDIYSAINAGRVGLYDRSDANNGGAPGTVRDKVEKQMAGHKIKAAQLLGFQKFDTPARVSHTEVVDPEITPAPVPNVPGYVPLTGPRREGAAPGTPYVDDGQGGYRLAYDEPPTAMMYGRVNEHTNRRPDYIRSGIPGIQAQYVPPEMRGPFHRPIQRTGSYTVGAPTTDPVTNPNDMVPASSDIPGVPLDEATPINEQLAALLSKPIQTEPTPAILDESAGLNMDRTAPNISVPAQTPTLPIPANTIKPEDIVPTPQPVAIQPPVPPAPPPSVPISTDNNPDLPRTEVVKQDAPTSFTDMLNTASSVGKDTLEGVKEFGAKIAGNLTGYPFELAGGIRAAIPTFSGIDRRESAENLINLGQKMREGSDAQFGVSPTGNTIFQKAAALAGRNLTPMGPSTLTATGLMMSADAASQFIGTANAKPLLTKDEAEKLLFPGLGNNQIGPQLPPRVSHTVMTSAGPAKLDDANYRLFGLMGAITIGAALLPLITKRAITTRVGRPIDNVPSGVEAFSNKGDLLRTADDKTAGLLRIAQGMKVDPVVLKDFRNRFEFETGSAVQNYANAAINHGEMKSPNFTYKVNTPLVKLAEAETEDVTRYMYLHHTLDQIRELDRIALAKTPQSAYGGKASMPSPGTSFVRGMDKGAVRMEIAAMEAGTEGQTLINWRKNYLEHQRAMWDFEYRGEYGMYTPEKMKELRTREPNKIYQRDLDIDNMDAGIDRVSTDFGNSQQDRMRKRMENEAKGNYIDQMVAHDPRFARQVSFEEFKKNEKSWGPNTVTFKRRGQTEYWVTDKFVRDTLMLDPYFINSGFSNIFNGTRKLAEATTTGAFAPQFAMTNLQRNYLLGRMSPENGFVGPTLLGTVKAIPQQLYPQMAKVFSKKLDDWSGGWMGNTFGQQNMHGLSLKLAQIHDQSLLMQLSKEGGVHTSMFLDYNKEASNALARLAEPVFIGPAGKFLKGIKNIFDAAHNAPNFAYASRNIKKGKTIGQAARSAKQLTGDPQKIGRYLNSEGKPIGFSETSGSGFVDKAITKAIQGYGFIHEYPGRQMSPWWNVTTQGMKRVGKAYLDAPYKFIGRAYLYNTMPAAALYMYTRGLGSDPNGIDYVDYAMNRRSPYKSFMTIYIPIKGRPAENGIEIPLPHELATMWAMTAAAMHHATGSELFTRADDFMRAALSMVGQTWEPADDVPVRSTWDDTFNLARGLRDNGLMPATPPLIGAIAGSLGYVTPNGPFGGGYQKHDEVFDNEGMNTTFELIARAMAPGIADIVGSGYAAMTHSPDAFSGINAGVSATGRRFMEKTSLIGGALGYRAPVAGSTQITEDMFGDKSILSKLAEYYKRRDSVRDRSDKKEPGSEQGRKVAQIFMPEMPPNAGKGHSFYPAKPPVNALYNLFIQELDRYVNKDIIGKDGLPTGGIGWKSQMAVYSMLTDHIKALRKIDGYNNVTLKARIDADPELKDYLDRYEIPHDNPRAIRNFLETQRQTAAKQLMFTLKAVEQKFQERLGDPNFSFEKLDPNKPMLLPPGVSPEPAVPTWPPYAEQVGAMERKSHHKKTGTIQLPPQ